MNFANTDLSEIAGLVLARVFQDRQMIARHIDREQDILRETAWIDGVLDQFKAERPWEYFTGPRLDSCVKLAKYAEIAQAHLSIAKCIDHFDTAMSMLRKVREMMKIPD